MVEKPVLNTLASDTFAVTQYDLPEQPQAKRKFYPWHKPRKQYVRRFQWVEQINKLLEEHPRSGIPLKYLGLPGDDLLDLRFIHQNVCTPNRLGLRFLGFNTSDHLTELNISIDEVKRLDGVDHESEVSADNFARLSDSNSMAYQKATTLGPFDVVNIDLCDGFAYAEPGVLDDSYYNAVNQLMTIQARKPEPWLLFLTTRSNGQNISTETLSKLKKKFGDNLDQYDDFRSASSQQFGIHSADQVQKLDNDTDLLPVIIVGLTKWFIGLGLSHQPSSTVKLTSAMGYRVRTGSPVEDLISIALKISPNAVPPADPMGLAMAESAGPSEGELATKAITQVSNRVDADKLLSEDTDLAAIMIEQSEQLLKSARYDVSVYREWVSSQIG